MKARALETVVLRFKFKTFNAIPKFIRQMKRFGTRKQSPPPAGEQAIEAVKGVSSVQLLLDLEKLGNNMISASCEEFLHAKGSYFIVQYVFARNPGNEAPSQRFLMLRDCLRKELFSILNDALWETTVYVNPCIKRDGTPAAIKRWASIAFCTREPFYEGGEAKRPVMVWQKDDLGERVGDAPLPLAPSYHLRTLDNAGFILMKAA